MANAKLNEIVKEMGQYFGVRSSIVLQSQTGQTAEATTINTSQTFLTAESNEFLRLLMSKSNTAPSAAAIIKQAAGLKDEKLPLLITPKSKSEGLDGANLNLKKKSKTQQGVIESEGFYTMEDLFGAQSENNVIPNITVFQNFSPINSASTIDTDIVSLYMKSTSSLEMSRAVPYLEIGIASAVSKTNGEVDKTKNYTFLGRFLGSFDGNSNSVTEKDLQFYNADADPSKKNPRFDPIDELEKTGRTLAIIGGMETFTSPQTMVNATRTHASTNGAVLDQFQPFMSLLSLRLSVVGQGGLMSFKSGNLELMLHDRARLNEIASLIAPDRFGNTRLIITYGWSHPDGNSIERQSNDKKINNLIGDLIDSMRVTETYLISNSKFSFEESSVKVSLSIAMLGGKTLGEMDVSLALGDELSNRVEQVKEDLKNLSDLLNELNRGKSANKISTISVPTFLRNPESITTANQESLVKAVSDLRSALTSNSSNPASKGLSETLNKMFTSPRADASNRGAGGFTKNSGGDVVTLVKNVEELIAKYIGELKKLDDPFLPEGLGADKIKHVSLGKILTCFLGNAFKKQFGGNVEIQLFFHPFNHESGRMHDYNVSQFFFAWDEFENVIKSQYSPFKSMTFGKLFNILQQYFINDLGGPAYDFIDDEQRKNFTRRDPKNLTARSSKVKGKLETKPYEEALETGKSKKLKEYYYGNQDDLRPASFRLPQLSVDLQAIPLRTSWFEGASEPQGNQPATVIKLHVMDRCCEGIYTATELVRSSPGRTFSRLTRKTQGERQQSVYRSNHSKYSDAPIDLLVEKGFLKRLDAYFNEISPGESKFNKLLSMMVQSDRQEIQRILEESYLIFDASAYVVKDLIKGIYPSFDYGTLGSGVLKASVSSIDDSGLATIMLIRGGQGAKGSEGETSVSSVPMSVMPSAVSIDTIGCPYFSFAQFYFIDFGTNTNVDNVYAVTGIDHVIEPGKFQTNVKLTWADSFAVFKPLEDSMREAALKAVLQRLGVYNNQASS
jgi:hypothetical protein